MITEPHPVQPNGCRLYACRVCQRKWSDLTGTIKGLIRELRPASARMSGLNAIKTRYRPLICPLELVLEEIPHGGRLFDIGCGTGALLHLALRLRSLESAHGCDISASAVEASAAFEANPCQFRVTLLAAEDTPPDLSGYDTITMIDVLHHLPPNQQDDFLRKLINRMDRSASLILMDIEASHILGSWCNQIHDLLLAREWVHPRRASDVAKVLQGAGANVAKLLYRRTFWYPHFQIVATKL